MSDAHYFLMLFQTKKRELISEFVKRLKELKQKMGDGADYLLVEYLIEEYEEKQK